MNHNKHTYISTATTTVVSNRTQRLVRIILGETAAGAITIFKGRAADGVIIGVLKASIAEQTFEYDVYCPEGFDITTAGASKLTVVHSDT